MEIPKSKKNSELIVRLLRRISNGEDPELLRSEATKLMAGVAPLDIAHAEQQLLDSGFSAQLVQDLSSAFIHMGIMEDQVPNLKATLPDNHIVRKVMAEHELTRCTLADLEDVTAEIEKLDSLTDVSSEFRKLSHTIMHLRAMEEHIEREEDIIFPYLKNHGWTNLCKASQNDHVYIRIAVNDLVKLISTYKPERFKEFRTRLTSITKYLCPRMRDHIFQEDNILYPIAIELIKDQKLWDQMKHVCEEIGYCGIHI